MGVGVSGSTAVRISALAMNHKNLKELGAQEDTDLGHLEKSVSGPEAQLDSLAEVFLQNHRGLNSFLRHKEVSLYNTRRNMLLLKVGVI